MESTCVRLHPDLPIFALARGNKCVFYTPGHAAVGTLEQSDALRRFWFAEHQPIRRPLQTLAAELNMAARQAMDAWRRMTDESFTPHCLTLHLSSQCNLACAYCHALAFEGVRCVRSGERPTPVFDEHVVVQAAALVARHCAKAGKPFTFVAHGGGEPTTAWEQLCRMVEITREAAKGFDLEWFGYIATNGVMETAKVRWLAENFSLIGLSCDGPPDIQNQLRPLRDGTPSSGFIEQTAQVVRDTGGRLMVRATITPQTMTHQSEIVAYVHSILEVEEMRFEPVYCIPSGELGAFTADDAATFVEHLLMAQKEAGKMGCQVTFSGARVEAIHGPYCSVLNNTLRLLPPDTVSACFLCAHGDDPDTTMHAIGSRLSSDNQFLLDHERIAALRHRAAHIPNRCMDCFNHLHCDRQCPEVCAAVPASTSEPTTSAPGFRCLVQRGVAEAHIWEAAETWKTASRPAGECICIPDAPDRELAEIKEHVDLAAILRQWSAVKDRLREQHRALPEPVWARRGWEHDGEEAWWELSRLCTLHGGPLSAYLHVPFCNRRCGFCDCYSVYRKPGEVARLEAYLQALCTEMAAWSECGMVGSRRLTTVHLGGGSPNSIPETALELIISRLREQFSVGPATEWALESTSSALSREHLQELISLGFSRLHIGVQTLEMPLRLQLGRREPAHEVLRRVECAIDKGLVVSVDMIYGLPGDTPHGFVKGLEELVAVGTHGFSLYHLQRSNRNRRFLMRHQSRNDQSLHDYILCQVGEQVLSRHGYAKTHFSHFALPEDRNLYYSHSLRGEDLLALGPTADGIFGHYHYRHPTDEAYVQGVRSHRPILEGGLTQTALERELQPLVTGLMSGTIHSTVLEAAGMTSLLEQWSEELLIESIGAARQLQLTANGSWFISTMLDQVMNLAATHTI